MDRETIPTPVVETNSAGRKTLETHLSLLERAAVVISDGSWDECLFNDIKAELAKWERVP